MHFRISMKLVWWLLLIIALSGCTNNQPTSAIADIEDVEVVFTPTISELIEKSTLASTLIPVSTLRNEKEDAVVVATEPALTIIPTLLPSVSFTFSDQAIDGNILLNWMEEILIGSIVEIEASEEVKKFIKHSFSGQVYAEELEDQLAYSSIFSELKYSKGGTDYVVIITETFLPPPFEPYPDSPIGYQLLSVAWFEKVEKDADVLWKLQGTPQRISTIFTGDGRVIDGDFVKISENSYAFWTKNNSPSNGFSIQYLRAVLVDEGFLIILKSEEIGSSGWLCADPPDAPKEEDCWFYDSTFEFVKNPQHEFYDLEITSVGTTGYVWSDAIEEVNETKIFRFTGEEYELVSD